MAEMYSSIVYSPPFLPRPLSNPAESPKATNARLAREAMTLGEQSSTCRASTL